jgi:hypothetical protein
LKRREFAISALQSCPQNRIAIEELRKHDGQFSDFTYALAAEWRTGNGKTAAASQRFRPDLQRAQGLKDHVRPLKLLAAALRQTSGEVATSV